MKARSVYETLEFERGRDPKSAMGIGIEARLKNLDKKTDWGFEISHAFHIKVWDIIEWNGYLIKISEVSGSDGIPYYMPLDDSGEPYMSTPPMFVTPEEALEYQKKAIDPELPA